MTSRKRGIKYCHNPREEMEMLEIWTGDLCFQVLYKTNDTTWTWRLETESCFFT